MLTASISGVPPFTLQWQLNGTNFDNRLIKTVAGNGSSIDSGNGGLATNAGLNIPDGVALDSLGNLYISDSGSGTIRKVNASGMITTYAGKGSVGLPAGDGGPATNASIRNPNGVAIDAAGNLFIADNSGGQVRKVNAAGIISTLAGNRQSGFSGDGGPATNASLENPTDVAADSSGNVFIADSGHGCVRKVDTNGFITTVAGTGTNQPFSGDGGAATNAGLSTPKSVAVDFSGDLFIADTSHGTIRKVDTNGIITSVAGIGSTGSFAGDGGPATNATFSAPVAVKVDAAGNIFILDSSYGRIRKVDTNGIISTVAGKGNFTGFTIAGDGGPATNALFNQAVALVLDAVDNIYIADSLYDRVREIYVSPTLSLTNVSLTNAGSYTLTVTSPYGTATVNQTVAIGLAPLQYTLPISNKVTFQFTGKAVAKYVLQSATNLTLPVVWTPVATNFASPTGLWTATATNKSPNLYYRVSTP
jgi:sugar lactone lactonase YvrE